jgi:hypothetical protein
MELTNELSPDDEQTAIENLEVIESELTQPAPRKGFLKTAIAGLQAIKGTAEFGAAVVALMQFVHSLL